MAKKLQLAGTFEVSAVDSNYLTVCVTVNRGVYSADKTYSEILSAHLEGKLVIVLYNVRNTPRLYAVTAREPVGIRFREFIKLENSNMRGEFFCSTSDVWTYTETEDTDEGSDNVSIDGETLVIETVGENGSDVEIPETLPNPHPLTFTGAVEATYDGSKAVSVEIPQGGGGESEWKYIGEFTALENVNPLIINADSDGNPFACKEFRIQCLLCFFHLSTNGSVNRGIQLIGDDGKMYDLSLNNVPTAIFPLTKAASLDGVTADIARNNVTLDITTHGNIIVCDMAADTLNYPGGYLNVNSIRNRGLNHTADKFKEIRVALGFSTNLLLAGSYLRVWGR